LRDESRQYLLNLLHGKRRDLRQDHLLDRPGDLAGQLLNLSRDLHEVRLGAIGLLDPERLLRDPVGLLRAELLLGTEWLLNPRLRHAEVLLDADRLRESRAEGAMLRLQAGASQTLSSKALGRGGHE
jgi:hypothetical protein